MHLAGGVIPSAEATRAPVAELFQHPRHACGLEGAPLLGEARGGTKDNKLIVRLALWPGPSGRMERARWMASTCVALMAFSELACRLLDEEHLPPLRLDRDLLCSRAEGVSPNHRDRADLVLEALRSALLRGVPA